MEPVNLFDLEQLARETLPEMVFGYFASGAEDEITLRRNREAFERLQLHYRVLMDVSEREMSTEILGRSLEMPILVAPSAFHKMAHPEGEIATAKAAKAAGSLMILSTMSTVAVEDVTAAAGTVWFQLYIYKDRGVTRTLVDRAVEAGCEALVLTVDVPVLGRRERDVRSRFRLPPGLVAANLLPAGMEAVGEQASGSGLAAYVASLQDPSISWRDVEWLREICPLPILLKGIVRPDDALRARDHGAAGVIVSNHGGRQLDTAPASIEVLPEIAEALDGHLEILLDGGVRRGTDVVKALALGARAVLIGRPVLWGLAVEGQGGVERVLGMLREEFDIAMALCGCRKIEEVTRDLVRP